MLVYYAFIALLTSLLSDATTALRMDTIVATRTLNSPANIKFLQLSQTKCPSVRYEKNTSIFILFQMQCMACFLKTHSRLPLRTSCAQVQQERTIAEFT